MVVDFDKPRDSESSEVVTGCCAQTLADNNRKDKRVVVLCIGIKNRTKVTIFRLSPNSKTPIKPISYVFLRLF